MNINNIKGISPTDDEAAVGADLSRPPPIYRPTRTLLCILPILLIVIIGPTAGRINLSKCIIRPLQMHLNISLHAPINKQCVEPLVRYLWHE